MIFIHNGVIKLQGNVDDLRAEHGKSIDMIFKEVTEQLQKLYKTEKYFIKFLN